VACGSTSLRLLASFDPGTSSWRTWPPCAPGASAGSSPTWPRSGMTRNGRAYAPATSARRTAATGSSSSPGSPPPCPVSCLLPTPTAGGFNDTESLACWQARRDRQKQLGRNGNGMGMRLSIAVRLLPTPTAVTTWRSPAEHMAWRHDNGRTQPCDLQVAVVLQVAPPDPGDPGRHAGPGRRPGCAPSKVLAVPCKLNPAPRSRRPTVGADTRCPCRVSSPARCRSDFVVHRNGDSGSPRSPGSTSASSAAGSCVSCCSALLRPPPSRRTRPPGIFAALQLEHALAHGGLADPSSLGDNPNPAMPEQPRLGRE
jgi:hypothetical protein